MKPYLSDPDFTLYNGDVLDVLRAMPDESVDCCVTSPPYWGLRDYGDKGAAMRGRNIRSVWEIATQPYPEAHFATYPEELVRRCLLAGCAEQVCRECGKTRERVVEREFVKTRGNAGPNISEDPAGYDKGSKMDHPLGYGRYDVTTTGFTDCGHGTVRCTADNTPIPHAVLRGQDLRDVRNGEADAEASADVLAEVRSEAGGEGGAAALVPEEVGRLQEQPRLLLPLQAGPSDGDRQYEEMGTRASVRHGGSSGTTPDEGRGSSPSQRNPERQPLGELGASDALAASGRSDVPSLPAHIQPSLDACPACGGTTFRYDEDQYRPGVVLDPFLGSGTTALVARKHGRRCVGIELNEDYCKLAAKRLSQQSLFAETS